MLRTTLAILTTLATAPAWAVDFQSPSGNIHCVLWADPEPTARCDLIENTPTHPRPIDCDLDWGHAYGVGKTGAGEALCAGDTIIMPTSAVLEYNGRITRHGFTCASAPEGVTCTNPEGRGFFVSRAVQRLF